MKKSIILKIMVSVLICLTVFLPANILAASKPATPAIKSASGSATSITVKWNKVSGATKYKLQWRPAGGDWDTDGKSKTTSDTSYNVTGLNEGKLYWFRLYAINDAGTSGKSPNFGCYTTPKAPTTSIVDTTSIKVKWSGTGGNSYYELLCRKSGESNYVSLGKFLKQYNYTVTGLAPGSEYYFRIKVYNQDDSSVISKQSGATSGYTKLNAPTLNYAKSDSVSISWSRGVLNGDYSYTYRVRRRLASGGDYTNIAVVSDKSYTDTGLQPNTSYAYYIDVLRNGSYCVHSNVLYAQTDEIYAESISLNETSLSLEPGQTYQLYGNIYPENTTNKNITWNSSDSNIVRVENGYITAIAPGTAYITATTSNGRAAACTVNVEKLAESISLNETSVSLEPGQTYQLYGNIYPENTTNKNIIWSSSNESVATVSENGLVTAIAYGKANITATTINGLKTTCDIFVLPPKDEDGLTWFLDSNGTLIIDGESTINKSYWENNRSNIKDVVILYGVTSISSYAFEDCNNLVSVSIPDSVTSIGYNAFRGCKRLTSINIPDSVTSIGFFAFSDTAYYNDSSNWENNILYIGNHLVKAQSVLSGECVIRNNTKTIADNAFEYCESLTNVIIPNSVTHIGDSAFYGCKRLTSISIPDSVISVEHSSFEFCSGLTSISIPDSVTCIGSKAFSDTAYYNDDTNWENNILYIGNHLIKAKDDLFGACIIRNNTKTIANNAFFNCKRLTNINIPDSVTHIGKWSFAYCDNLTSIIIPDSVVSMGDAFYNCTGLTTATIGNSVTDIKAYTFSLCQELAEVKIGNNITSIGYSAFDSCKRLTNITIPDSVITISDRAFYDCSGLTNITIPNSVTSIGEEAFRNCGSLTRLNVPDSVTIIGNSAFWGCNRLTSISVGLNNINYCDEDGILYNKDKTEIVFFPPKKEKTDFIIPKSVIIIDDRAFYNCWKLTSITIPNSVTNIGNESFYGCSNLTSIIIPDGVTSIGDSAFYDCGNLTSIIIPDNVTSIGDSAFYGCKRLTGIIIPESVTSIGNSAFYDCGSLTNIIIPNGITNIGYFTFAYCYSLTSITIPNSVTNISDCAFCYCSSLTNITIPNSVTNIGDRAFPHCTSLTSITIPDSVTSIGNSAFSDCENLTSITIPNSVTTIGQNVLEYCINLNHIYYIGKKEEWDKINIAGDNKNLKNATIHYCHRINYNANGATNTPQSQYAEENTDLAISSEIPIRTGYSFLGWATSADATVPNYQPGDTILIGTEDITLYAVWDRDSYTTTSRSLNGNESIFTVTPTKVPMGSEIIIACYKSGTLTNIQHQKNENKVIEFIVTADYDAVKVFAFDGFDGMIPLTDAENVEWK